VVNNQKHRFKGAILKIGCKDRDLFWEIDKVSEGNVLISRQINISMPASPIGRVYQHIQKITDSLESKTNQPKHPFV
jgi:hypothetical protein